MKARRPLLSALAIAWAVLGVASAAHAERHGRGGGERAAERARGGEGPRGYRPEGGYRREGGYRGEPYAPAPRAYGYPAPAPSYRGAAPGYRYAEPAPPRAGYGYPAPAYSYAQRVAPPTYAPPPGQAPGRNSLGAYWGQQQGEARRGVREGALAPMGQVTANIRRSTPGRMLDAGLEPGPDGRPAYRVRWAAAGGRRIDFIVDAATGAIIGQSGY